MPTRSERKIWRSLRRRKGRQTTGLFLLEGPRLLAEALATGTPTDVILHEPTAESDPAVRDLLARAGSEGRRVENVPMAWIEEVADAATPQAVLAIARTPAWGWSDVGAGLIVLLDGLQDPGNFGTLVRTAVGLGAAGVVGIGESADPWGPKAVRASAGASLRAPVFRASGEETLAWLAERGVTLWAASAEGRPLERGQEPPGALALGSETRGVSAGVRAVAERTVSVAMRGGTESLNVAAAGAILLDRLLGEQ